VEYSFKLVTGRLQPPAPPASLAGRIGALVTFAGHVRGEEDGRPITELTYGAYAELAREESARIAGEIAARWPVLWLGVRHRLGPVAVGEQAVWIGVGAARREAAYAASRHYLEQLKERLAIWKAGHPAEGRPGPDSR
jgi:molybdopterin synthase catalytic subunit